MPEGLHILTALCDNHELCVAVEHLKCDWRD